jgi:hypothetical protein
MSISSNEASKNLEKSLNDSKNLEAQFKLLSETATKKWQDTKQRQFYDRYIFKYNNTLNEFTREINSILIQVKSIENTLKSIK